MAVDRRQRELADVFDAIDDGHEYAPPAWWEYAESGAVTLALWLPDDGFGHSRVIAPTAGVHAPRWGSWWTFRGDVVEGDYAGWQIEQRLEDDRTPVVPVVLPATPRLFSAECGSDSHGGGP